MVKKHRIYIKLWIDLFQVENGNYKNSCINSWRVAGCHYPIIKLIYGKIYS